MSLSVENGDEPQCSTCTRDFMFDIANQLEKQNDILFPYCLSALIRSIKEVIMIS